MGPAHQGGRHFCGLMVKSLNRAGSLVTPVQQNCPGAIREWQELKALPGSSDLRRGICSKSPAHFAASHLRMMRISEADECGKRS